MLDGNSDTLLTVYVSKGIYWYPYYNVGKLKVCAGTLITEEVS